MLISLLWQDPIIFIIVLGAIMLAISVHEFGHALASFWQGDPTAAQEGRLSLNPRAHIDPLGLLLLIFVGFGWGKPVPFNPYNLKFPRFGPLLVAIAGPFFNLLSVAIFAIILHFLSLSQNNLLVIFLQFLIVINLNLAIFNLIPLPPLDGSKILYVFLINRYEHIIEWLERYGLWIILFFLFFGFPGLSYVLTFFQNLIFSLI